ncbi:MAG: hypothetical protein AAFP19_15670, partial [Bacteroidota bacterium]
EDGDIYSAGVATNEPSIGYDECALRYAKKWTVEAFLKTSENYFFEYPINAAYYPGASVGYSQVTVRSLATDMAMNSSDYGSLNLPSGFATTGYTVNEFYTAKDFPVLVEETNLQHRNSDLPRIPFTAFFNFSSDKYTGTQGYAITLNDMHGKARRVAHYGTGQMGIPLDQRLSEVVYTYASKNTEITTVANQKRKVNSLDNEVVVLKNDASDRTAADMEIQELGVDYEFFMDTREASHTSADGYLGFNIDLTSPLVFGLTAFPNLTVNVGRTRTAVTNKVIRKTGILIRTDAYDGQSHITTSNKVFDPMTGEPLLTTVNNSFDQAIYNYNIPARLAYDRMGEAYKNWGMSFEGLLSVDRDCGYFSMQGLPAEQLSRLVKGDLCVVTDFTPGGGSCGSHSEICDHPAFVYVGEDAGVALFENAGVSDDIGTAGVEMKIMRSGRRNHLTAKAGNVTAMADPTIDRTVTSGTVTINLPDASTGTVPFSYGAIDQVLNASAVTYSDAWDLEREVEERLVEVENSFCRCLYVSFDYTGTPPNCPVEVTFRTADGNNNIYIVDPIPSGSCGATGLNNCEKIICSSGNFTNISYRFLDGPCTDITGVTFDVLASPEGECGTSTCNECLIAGGIIGGVTGTCNPPLWRADFTINGRVYTDYSGINLPAYQCDIIPASANYDFCHRFICSSQPIIVSDVRLEFSDCEGDISSDWEIIDGSCNHGTSGGTGGGSTTNVPLATASFDIGQRGIWRPYRNYVYVDERTANHKNVSGPIDLATDGQLANDLVLFDWQNPFFTQASGAQKWKMTNEITKYGRNGEEMENRDIIGLYSAALYGYKDNLPIAVGANAAFVELAFDGFEEYSDPAITSAEENGNFDFECLDSEKTTSLTYNVLGGYQGETTIWIDKKYYPNLPLPNDAFLLLQDHLGNEYEAAAGVSAVNPLDPSATGSTIAFRGDICALTLTSIQSCELPTGSPLTGRVVLRWKNSFSGSGCNVAVDPNFAHSGDRSMKINSTTTFDQKTLQLESNRRYVFSAWVRRFSELPTPTFDDGRDWVAINMGSTSINVKPAGAIIEGWQRMEAIFTYTGDPLSLTLNASAGAWNIDDIRIFPEDGSLQTYVYDPNDYRLQAVLDNNNYATFYHYDEEGNLFLIKKETARGIQTIQETREYIKDSSM